MKVVLDSLAIGDANLGLILLNEEWYNCLNTFSYFKMIIGICVRKFAIHPETKAHC